MRCVGSHTATARPSRRRRACGSQATASCGHVGTPSQWYAGGLALRPSTLDRVRCVRGRVREPQQINGGPAPGRGITDQGFVFRSHTSFTGPPAITPRLATAARAPRRIHRPLEGRARRRRAPGTREPDGPRDALCRFTVLHAVRVRQVRPSSRGDGRGSNHSTPPRARAATCSSAAVEPSMHSRRVSRSTSSPSSNGARRPPSVEASRPHTLCIQAQLLVPRLRLHSFWQSSIHARPPGTRLQRNVGPPPRHVRPRAVRRSWCDDGNGGGDRCREGATRGAVRG